MPAPPCMESVVPDDTAYDQLQLLCLRESGTATELLKGTKALNLRTPELAALTADMLEAQRVFVCALGRWTEHTAGPAARRLAGKLAGVSEALDAAARRGRDLPSGAAATGLWADAADAATRRAAAGARAAALVRAFDTVDEQLADVADDLAGAVRGAARGSPLDPDCGAVPLCAAAVHARLEATRAVAQLVLDALCAEDC